MTRQPRPLYAVLADYRERQKRRQPCALGVAILQALATPPDPSVEAFRQMYADTIRQQEKSK